MQTALLKYDINQVFEMLPLVCSKNNYTIREINIENKIIRARKGRFLFSGKLELELRVLKLDNEILNIGVKILKNGTPQKDLEEKFVNSIYNFF